MEVIYVLNGSMERLNHSPNVIKDKSGTVGFSYEFYWTAACEPKVILRDAIEVDMRTVHEIENLRG